MDEAARAMDATLVTGDPGARWSAAAIDSRRVEGGELFFALPGERTDGHRFVDAALDAGAAGAVVARPPERDAGPAPSGAVLRVDDPFEALHALVRHLRPEVPETLVGITGSMGKTTTKELLAAMLAERFRTAKSRGNLNNTYGFPVSFLAIPDDTEAMVAEMGMSVPGELGRVSRLGRPDVAVLLNVRAVHLENFDSVAAIAEAKSEILDGLVEGGLVVANRADPEVVRVVERHARRDPSVRLAWFVPVDEDGAGEASVDAADAARPAWARALDSEPLESPRVGTRFVLETRGLGDEPADDEGLDRRPVELPLHGRYNVDNCLAAAACARALGVAPEAIARALAGLVPEAHRGVVRRLGEDVLLIDDCYNSNPEAVARALEAGAELARQGAVSPRAEWGRAVPRRTVPRRTVPPRTVAVLGDMLELGPEAPRFHREAGKRAAELGFSPVLAVGSLAAELASGARAGGAEAVELEDARAAAAVALERVEPGDLVLVKGSRGVALERVVDALVESFGDADDRGRAANSSTPGAAPAGTATRGGGA